MAQDIRDAKFEALRRSNQYRKILETDEIRKAQFQEHRLGNFSENKLTGMTGTSALMV
jgi:hypothetical protein